MSGIADLGFAKLDLARQDRCGFPEVIYAPGKTPQALVQIVERLRSAGQTCLATRVDDEQARLLATAFPEAEQDRVGRTFFWPTPSSAPAPGGRVLVVTAGTADLPVAHEAATTARAWGCTAEVLADVGVAGVHRVLHHLDKLRAADVLVVVAGMEAALPSLIGGLVAVPVIGVPTSVGYGAHMQGLAALLGMLNSCAPNVAVVNIDAGFKGGYLAGMLARRAGVERSPP